MKAKDRDLKIFLAKTGRPLKGSGLRVIPTVADLARPVAQQGAPRGQRVRLSDRPQPSEGAGGTGGRASRQKGRKGQ